MNVWLVYVAVYCWICCPFDRLLWVMIFMALYKKR